ncbi:MAG: redoxin family protein, partial [Chlamydiia bacterium]|nr:redoxin family protein [Chlamydiia bacterium]
MQNRTKITFKGDPIHTVGSLPKTGSIAPEFTLVKHDLSEIKLSQMPGRAKILNIVPSLDTAVCALSFKTFVNALEGSTNILFYTISKDLPFAQMRVCLSENLPNSEVLSAFRSN